MKQRLQFLFHLGLRSIVAAFILLLSLLCILMSSSNSTENRADFLHKVLGFTVSAENWFYEMRNAHMYEHSTKAPGLVLVKIDDAALQSVGRWPWSRAKMAELTRRLDHLGAKVIAFDIFFSEKESAEADGAFAAAIKEFQAKKHHQVLSGYNIEETNKENPNLPVELYLNVVKHGMGTESAVGHVEVDAQAFVIPELTNAEIGLGFISAKPDYDGVFRRSRLVAAIGSDFFPSLGFAAFLAHIKNIESDGATLEKQNNTLNKGDSLDLSLIVSRAGKESLVELNALGELPVRYYGAEKSFETISAKEIFEAKNLDDPKLKNLFADKTVFVGSTAYGANDLRHTPVDPTMPGVYMHMNVFHMLDQNYFYRSDDVNLLFSLLLFVVGIGIILLASVLREPLLEAVTLAFVALSAFFLDRFYFSANGYLIRLFFCELSFLSLYAWFTILNVFEQAREKKKIRDTFTRYVAPEIVKEMLANPEKLKVGGEKKELSMLFSDVRDFTSISERLTPQELSSLLNLYMGKMTDILFSTHGTLDKYIGDALVGFWGAPVDVPEQAYQAVRGATMMLEALPEINQEFERRKFPKINIGIGINTGEVNVGNMGSDKIFAYTALGDHMNLASRLESLTKYYGANLLISEFTEAKLGSRRSEFCLRAIDKVRVKGRSSAVTIFEVLPSWHPMRVDGAIELFARAYEQYLAANFGEAEKLMSSVLALCPTDKASERFRHAAQEYQQKPPPESWDGVTNYDTK